MYIYIYRNYVLLSLSGISPPWEVEEFFPYLENDLWFLTLWKNSFVFRRRKFTNRKIKYRVSLTRQFSRSIFLWHACQTIDSLSTPAVIVSLPSFSPFSLYFFIFPASSRYNAFNNRATLLFFVFLPFSPLHPMNWKGPRNYATVTLPYHYLFFIPTLSTCGDRYSISRARIISLSPNRTENDDAIPISKESNRIIIEYSPRKVSSIQFSNKKSNRSFFSPLILSNSILIFYTRYTRPFFTQTFLHTVPYFSPEHVSIKHPRKWALTLFIFPIKVKIYASFKHYFQSRMGWNGEKDATSTRCFARAKLEDCPAASFISPRSIMRIVEERIRNFPELYDIAHWTGERSSCVPSLDGYDI